MAVGPTRKFRSISVISWAAYKGDIHLATMCVPANVRLTLRGTRSKMSGSWARSMVGAFAG